MRVYGNIGGSIDGTGGADLAGISDQVAAAKRVGYDGVWTTEVSRDPFLSLLLAADRSPGAEAGHRDRGGVRTEPDDRGHHRQMICSEDCAGRRVDDLELAAQRLDIAACHPWNWGPRFDASSASARSGAPVGRARRGRPEGTSASVRGDTCFELEIRRRSRSCSGCLTDILAGGWGNRLEGGVALR